MRRFILIVAALVVSRASAGEWERLPALPDKEGFAGSFAGVSHGVLLVAGGANFPGKKPWEGGTKVWYDTVFALDRPDGAWRKVGRLPRPLGYGVAVRHREAVVCVGGSDAERHHAEVFRLEWREGQLHTTPLPSLPHPLANACGALVGDTLYIAGGQETPDARKALSAAWSLDLAVATPRWRGIDPCPGRGRILAVAAACGGAFWLAGGADLEVGDDGQARRQYLKDAYCYAPGAGWSRIADLLCPVVAAPSPAPADASGFFVLGGDDGAQVGQPPEQHRGFRREVLRYDLRAATWSEVDPMPFAAVTVPCVRWHARWVIPGGEVRPGVRTPLVWGWATGTGTED
jgi:N-acetylneuraminic acid mutarotase